MYAAGSSSSDDVDYSPTAHPQSSFRRKMRAHGILKCFILTPTAQYVNPVFADLFPASSDHPSPQRPNDNAKTTNAPTDVPHNIPSPHHAAVSRQRTRRQLFAASSPTSSTTLRSPSSTLSSTYSASPPSSLLKHVLVPTPPHSTAATGSTLASSPESGVGRGGGGIGGCDSTIGSPSMYHSLLHPSPCARSVASASSLGVASMTTPHRSPFDDPSAALSASSTAQDRGDTSLGALSRRFVSLIQTRPDRSLELNQAVELLGVGKRRIYDVTNVLEGIGLIAKVGKTHFEWTGADSDTSADPQLLSRVDALRNQVKDLADKERQLDHFLAILYQHSLQYANSSEEDGGAARIQHMYVRYSDVTDLHTFYGSDTIIGIKAPVGTNLEVPDPEQGMEAGKRRYHRYLSSKLPEGSVPLGAKDNRGPIRVYLVRPEAKPGESVASKPEPSSQQECEPEKDAKPDSKPATKRGSYVEPDWSAVKERGVTPAANERVPKRPYAQKTNPAAPPYSSPQFGPHPHPYYYYPDAASAWGHPPPHYYPMYYAPPPPPSAASAEMITPENDAKPPAAPPKRKRTPVPAGSPPYHRTTGTDDVKRSPLRPFEHPEQPWGRESSYDTNHPNQATHMAASGPFPPYWQRSIGPEFEVPESPIRHRHVSGISHQFYDQNRPHPSSPLMSPAAVDPSELFSMPLQSPLGSRQAGLGAGGSIGAPDRGLLLSPGASAPPGFSPRPMYDGSSVYSHRSSPPDPAHLSFPSLSEATPPRPKSQLGKKKKTKKAASSCSTAESDEALTRYPHRLRGYSK